jgi:hypothetical protein
MRPVLVLGIYLGAALTVVMLGALVIANRIPALESYAFERNAACYALFVMLMLVPVFRYRNRPGKMFIASMTGWILLAAAYNFAGMYFHSLFDVLHRTPFEVLAEGAIVFGLLAVAFWVCRMILHARRHAREHAAATPSGALSHNR